ncbi:demethylmenaquinone methyltransferase/2-methoxy-6-polyprenyl-1,4-benzoquinol methylase [Propionibacteriaceae bacterium ES.041]|uniref:demethylmenaquinone methyltransferase n=1 Tax=Enemella evansiae TaxID=2016499 RepID=UPI000B972331|nr:demethylmenaquinone methyltransferase [Enemella evansiae]OYN94058.1 bifunctional demethylmenaquinone methyltransferase/2-methoxy-6-polyprenyl-1,4-benzoquinol methylase [Enemella evansiae]PFG68652.1 demethylmenaquinone methyltransferase/2-methoxy-6-polyprenyl-1,4-benzoquinol methylase [Propionibacteriaceae bacterium ES.041]
MPKSDYRATLAKRRADVSAMFDRVAQRYDVMNDVMTMGQIRRWRRLVQESIDPKPGQRILDLAAGTGTSSRPLADAGALVVPTDLSLGMLRVGKEHHPDLPFLAGDALALPFADGVFDAVTISYGLRNVEHTLAALTEMRRVTRPGGRLVVAEFSTPTAAPVRLGYQQLVLRALPELAKVASSNPSAYHYLIESIRAWPDQRGLADLMVQAGWSRVEWRNLFGGVVALHRAVA